MTNAFILTSGFRLLNEVLENWNCSFLAGNPFHSTFCFWKYLFSDVRFMSYHMADTRMDYLPKENIAVKNSWLRVSLTLGHLPALPPPEWEKSLSVVEWWGLEGRWARWLSLCSQWHPFPFPLLPFQKQRQLLTIHLFSKTTSDWEVPVYINCCMFTQLSFQTADNCPSKQNIISSHILFIRYFTGILLYSIFKPQHSNMGL